MLKKILKGLFIWSGVSWTLYGMSENVLNYARLMNAKETGTDVVPKAEFRLAVKMAFDNFKEAYELLK